MRGRKPLTIELSQAQRQDLELLTRRHTTPQQIALRGRIVLAAADGKSNAQIAKELGVNVDTVRLWRARWHGLQALPLTEMSLQERLTDVPRPGKPVRIRAEQVCQIVALACETPQDSERPISQWSGREIADEIVKRGIVESISGRHAARLLKRGICSRT